MTREPMNHLDRAAEHLRDAVLVAQDFVYGMMGVAGALLVAVNSFEMKGHPREAGALLATGAVLIAAAAMRCVFRRSPRRVREQSGRRFGVGRP